MMHDDYVDFLSLLVAHEVEFVIVGAYALAFYGIPRYTGDIDILIRPSMENGGKVLRAISDFFGSTLGLAISDMTDENTIQFGRPPIRIDILKNISGVSLDEIWPTREHGRIGGVQVFFISKEMMIKNKLATGREKDLLDVKILRGGQ